MKPFGIVKFFLKQEPFCHQWHGKKPKPVHVTTGRPYTVTLAGIAAPYSKNSYLSIQESDIFKEISTQKAEINSLIKKIETGGTVSDKKKKRNKKRKIF
jgi:hypothetical protein